MLNIDCKDSEENGQLLIWQDMGFEGVTGQKEISRTKKEMRRD